MTVTCWVYSFPRHNTSSALLRLLPREWGTLKGDASAPCFDFYNVSHIDFHLASKRGRNCNLKAFLNLYNFHRLLLVAVFSQLPLPELSAGAGAGFGARSAFCSMICRRAATTTGRWRLKTSAAAMQTKAPNATV